MTKKTTKVGKEQAAELRRRAEARLGTGRVAPKIERNAPVHDLQRLVHELEVYQIELEMQNEGLQTARRDLEIGLARYTELFDFAPIGYATLDAGEAIKEINLAGARLLGAERSKLVGQLFSRFLSPGQHTVFRTLLGRAAESESTAVCELVLYRIGGSLIHLRMHAVVLAHSDKMTMLSFEDITERKTREEQLSATEQALREANLRTTEFLATLSHELRNPLAPIRNSLFLLERTEPGSDMARKAQTVIARQVTHLTRLVEDLLDVTRITRGKIQLQRERIEFGELVRQTVEDHRLSFETSGIQLECRIDPGAFWIDADPARLVQVLTNLLSNAEKFTSRGQKVIVSLQHTHKKVLLHVRDTGVGIPSTVLRHLFEPFAQGPQMMDRSRGGLGLGLATVKGLVELHGGTVGISSDGHNKGTTVTVLLPLVEAPAKVTMVVHEVPERKRRVLVIEDNEDAAKTLRDALSMCGHQVEMSFDGLSGIDLARRFKPEIVICDIGLPRMDGFEVAQIIRKTPTLEGAYLVALSGYTAMEDVDRAAEAGFNKHVAKPLTIEALDRIVKEAP